jgi:hypothetical protein
MSSSRIVVGVEHSLGGDRQAVCRRRRKALVA